MIRLWLVFVLVIAISACSSSQADEEILAVSGADADAAAGNSAGDQGLELGQESGLNENPTFSNQGDDESSSITDNNPLLNNEVNTAGGDGDMPMSMDSDGMVVRYTVGETNVYAQPDTASAAVQTLGQGEVLLVTISGEFAQSALGYIEVSNLSAELQPRSFSGNGWQ